MHSAGEFVEGEAEAAGRARSSSAAPRAATAARSISRGLEVDGVQLLVEEARAARARSRCAGARARARWRSPPGASRVRDALAVEGDLELGLDGRQALLVGARETAEVALASTAPELACRRPLEAGVRRLETCELLVAAVDLLEVERRLVSREVEVVLLVERGDEARRRRRGNAVELSRGQDFRSATRSVG